MAQVPTRFIVGQFAPVEKMPPWLLVQFCCSACWNCDKSDELR